MKYTRFHTTALCSPTRAALLSGRNHHAVGMGAITEMATSAPGYNSLRPNACASSAEVLKLNGYSTAQFGKCHEVPVFDPARLGRSITGRIPAAGSSTSTDSSAARTTSRFAERFNPDLAGRPNPVAGNTQLLFGGMHRLQENVIINIKNKSHAVTAENGLNRNSVATRLTQLSKRRDLVKAPRGYSAA